MKRVIGGVVFEDGEGSSDEFVKDGEDDGHLGLAIGFEAVGESLEPGISMACNDGRHEEDTAKVEIALGADARLAMDGGTAFVFAWSDTDPGGSSARAVEVAGQFSAKPAGGFRSDTLDLLETGAIVSEGRMIAQV